ncbi:MAG: hypothetical protein Q8O37_16735, partial [Sulfuricellaceae bacterium]|nr:hypothetical protein [Sulfuricellaceae bacterium]
MFSPNTLRRLSSLVLLTFTSLTLQPLQAAAQNYSAQPRAQSVSQSHPEKASRLINAIKETAKRAKGQAGKHLSTRESVKELRRQKTQLDALEQDVLDDLKATETHLKAKNLPPEIINRHKTA